REAMGESIDPSRSPAQRQAAAQEIIDMIVAVIAARRDESRDDVISMLVAAEIDTNAGRQRLSEQEIVDFARLLLVAGSGTTWRQLGIAFVGLLSHPEVVAAVRSDRRLVRPVIEEAIRWNLTDPTFRRTAVHDTVLGGVAIPAGSVVEACIGAANRAPARCYDPDRFDPFRPAHP